jgi:hypothetical protein
VGGHDEHVTGSRTAVDLSSVPLRHRVAERDASLADATAILAAHVPDTEDGTCAGCRAQWGRWINYGDCSQVVWARRVAETHAAWPDGRPDSQDRSDLRGAPVLARR